MRHGGKEKENCRNAKETRGEQKRARMYAARIARNKLTCKSRAQHAYRERVCISVRLGAIDLPRMRAQRITLSSDELSILR